MKVNISAPNLAVICLDSRTEDGRLYHRYAREATAFHQFSGLILDLEHFFDEIGYPQASLQTRRFDGKKAVASGTQAGKPDVAWSAKEMLAMRGRLATFVVHVRMRQRATWQGECCWVEGDESASFVSELELLKLLEAAAHKAFLKKTLN